MESVTVYRQYLEDNWEPICNLEYDSEYECDIAAEAIWNLLSSHLFSETNYRVVGAKIDDETSRANDDDNEALCSA